MMVTVTATDRPGLLAATTAALQRVGAKVWEGSTTGIHTAVWQSFVV
jgi:predicted amino acid-binding ACT domain protein